MIAKAELRFERIQARKTRLVLDLIKGKTVEEALFLLDSTNKRVVQPIKKLLFSAFSNANFNRQDKLLAKDVFVSEALADEGPMFKRYRAATMGRAAVIRHRTTHIYIELDKMVKTEREEKQEAKGQEPEVRSKRIEEEGEKAAVRRHKTKGKSKKMAHAAK